MGQVKTHASPVDKCRVVTDLYDAQEMIVQHKKELRILQEENEDIFNFLQLPPEDILLRWVNFVLEQTDEIFEPVKNFEGDFADCRVFLGLQNQTDPDMSPEDTW